MRVLVISTSRADRNGQEVVATALSNASHSVWFATCEIRSNRLDDFDIAVVAGDRSEMLAAAVECVVARLPICHIAGGDRTEGSADDRFRDAISSLACIHCVTHQQAFDRLFPRLRNTDWLVLTGSPALDAIRLTPILGPAETFKRLDMAVGSHHVIVAVHPNTVGEDRLLDFRAVMRTVTGTPDTFRFLCLGANADPGGRDINDRLRAFVGQRPGSVFHENLAPELFYSAMTHCDAMIGNSSAAYYESAMFGIPCIDIGFRQKGRIAPDTVINVRPHSNPAFVRGCLLDAMKRGRVQCKSPYGDGHSAPRIVKALEDNSWRWAKKRVEEKLQCTQ